MLYHNRQWKIYFQNGPHMTKAQEMKMKQRLVIGEQETCSVSKSQYNKYQ